MKKKKVLDRRSAILDSIRKEATFLHNSHINNPKEFIVARRP